MKKILILAIAFLPMLASADCVLREVAQATIVGYLDHNGEKQFPYAFSGKSISQKVAVIERAADAMLPWTSKDKNGKQFLGFQSLVYAESNGNLRYFEYLTIGCDGRPSKHVERVEP